ncbi:MAG: hypothetical protein MUC38_09915 [Cyclobacteriaceae bacterium]|jgi:hypothetical protein|nr:hypothetical protein [Cyclobacteriaceae bacterium]
MKRMLLSLLLLAATNQMMLAQNYWGLLYPNAQVVSAGVNANPGMNVSADYLSSPSGFTWNNRPVALVGSVTMPLFSQKGFDIDVRVGAGTIFEFNNSFKILSGVSWGFHRSEDINGRYINTGFKLDFYPGHYGSKWVLAPHIGIDYRPWVHIWHSDYVKAAFNDLHSSPASFNGPVDGWFHQRYMRLQLGFSSTYFRERWNVNVIAGFQYDSNKLGLTTLPDIGILPFYGGVSMGYVLSNRNNNP